MEDERKQRSIAVAARKKMESDLKDLDQQVEMANKVKDDAVKQMKRLQAQMKEFQREIDEARLAKEEMAQMTKDNERKIKNLEAEVLRLQEELAAAERARRAAETDRDEVQDELNQSQAARLVNMVKFKTWVF